jgi:hypothetical protein
MNKLIVFLFCLLFITGTVNAGERENLLKELDATVKNRQYYMDRKEARIDSLRNLLVPDISIKQQYLIHNEIYKEYSTYRCDSAMRYVFYNKELADKMDNQPYKDLATINLSMLLSTTGMYLESIDNLKKIDRGRLDSTLLYEYYSICEWTYYTAGEYSNDSLYTPRYLKLEGVYRDSTFLVLSPETIEYDYYKGKRLMYGGQYAEALDIFTELYQKLPVDTRLYAIITFNIANMYHKFGNEAMYEKFLILAAISDQLCPLKENLAMQELALYLFRNKPKDLDRAYTYIRLSMEDARFYNNRLRMVQISEKMPIIVNAFQEKNQREKMKVTLALGVITFLSLAMIGLLLYVYKQMQAVKRGRRELRVLNKELNELNRKLNASNRTKEEYVGIFIDLCSSYIDKLDKYRETVKRKLMVNQIDDLYRMVNSTRAIEMELDDFFESFDNAFLKLFPTFIEDFNNLLLPHESIVTKKKNTLNRDLRIFALIRLGIADSSRIASFLRYSPQTVYNNRTKVKNKAKKRDTFEKDILQIGDYGVS